MVSKNYKLSMKLLTTKKYKNLLDTLSLFKNKIKEIDDESKIKNATIENLKNEYVSMQKVKDREIERLQKEISSVKEENNKIANNLIEYSSANTKLEEQIIKLKNKNSKISASKGGLTKQNNKLKNKLDAKDRVIEEYKMALEKAEKKNQLQADKIQSLTKKTSHSIEEYKNNGLRKNMKKKRGN